MAIGSAVISAASAVYSASSDRKAAKHQEHVAERAAGRATEREQRETKIRREQIEYESNLAAERAQWETSISLEKAEFTNKRISEEAAIVKAAQIVGYASSGIDINVGSPLVVMQDTSRIADTEKKAVTRGHEIFAETRQREVEEVERGGEQTYEWFMDRLHAETGYEVQSRLSEARMYRKKGKQATYGGYFNIASAVLSGASSIKTSLKPPENR